MRDAWCSSDDIRSDPMNFDPLFPILKIIKEEG